MSGGKKRSCFHLDFLIIEFCQIFQEWKDSKIENWEDLELWNKNIEAGTKWGTRSKVIFASLSNLIPPTWINPWRQHNYSLDGKSKREFETEEWGIKHTTKKKKRGCWQTCWVQHIHQIRMQLHYNTNQITIQNCTVGILSNFFFSPSISLLEILKSI